MSEIAIPPLPHERIDDGEDRETAEVPIGSPQLPDTMIAAKRSDASIMDLRTADAPVLQRRAKLRPIAFSLRQEHQTR